MCFGKKIIVGESISLRKWRVGSAFLTRKCRTWSAALERARFEFLCENRASASLFWLKYTGLGIGACKLWCLRVKHLRNKIRGLERIFWLTLHVSWKWPCFSLSMAHANIFSLKNAWFCAIDRQKQGHFQETCKISQKIRSSLRILWLKC